VIRKIYLYIFALLGLVLLIIGCTRFINMGLKAYVFTQADEEVRMYDTVRPMMDIEMEEKITGLDIVEEDVTVKLSKSQAEQLRYYVKESKAWEESQSKVDVITARRHRDAAMNLALILVGFPLYLAHWLIIRKETKG